MPKPARPAYHLYRWLWGSLDLLFPPTCGGCDRRGTLWCPECQGQVKLIKPPICLVCGQPFRKEGVCRRCSISSPKCKALRSWAYYEGPIRQAIKRLKYRRYISLGLTLARPLTALFDQLGWEIDLVIPVPLGVARLRERGYNQAALIARPFALETSITYSPRGLRRVRETRSQVGLSLTQRKDNVENAFQAEQEIVNQQRILIIDDVATSGATLNSCGAALYQAGAKDVYAMTLARA